MFLLTSAAYLNAEFTAELGALPPSFLPVGNRRLFVWQREAIRHYDGPIVLSLPGDFAVSDFDARTLDALGITVFRVPPGLTLGASVVTCIDGLGAHGEAIRILHGDTLIVDLDASETDLVGLARTSDYYAWADCRTDPDGRTVFREGLPSGREPREILCGYFAFSDASLLAQSITMADNRFVEGLNGYAAARPLALRREPNWLDFGHVQSYFQSKARMTTQRSFNSLVATKRIVSKSSADSAKILAEAHWFETVPADIASYCPHYLRRGQDDAGRPSYRVEYLHLSTLTELFVFGRLPVLVWGRILSRCFAFLQLMRSFPVAQPKPVQGSAYVDKTLRRLEQFAQQRGVSLEAETRFAGRPLPSLRRICQQLGTRIAHATPDDMTIWHGDFCFSNIFYDFRAGDIRVIDPRGRDFDDAVAIYGDARYDVAKLTHSVIGRYDFIVAGHYELRQNGCLDLDLALPTNVALAEIETEFGRWLADEPRWNPASNAALTALLFFAMLPLHDDDARRQTALLANGLRLYAALEDPRA